jgi:hypothetical protein
MLCRARAARFRPNFAEISLQTHNKPWSESRARRTAKICCAPIVAWSKPFVKRSSRRKFEQSEATNVAAHSGWLNCGGEFPLEHSSRWQKSWVHSMTVAASRGIIRLRQIHRKLLTVSLGSKNIEYIADFFCYSRASPRSGNFKPCRYFTDFTARLRYCLDVGSANR